MLRGINVSGHNTIRMEHLRALCAALGFRDVETYVQSGNIVFRAASMSPSILATRLSDALRGAAALARYRRIGSAISAMAETTGAWRRRGRLFR